MSEDLDPSQPPIFPLQEGDRIIVGYILVPPERWGGWNVWEMAVERKDGTRWRRVRMLRSNGDWQVRDLEDITGKTDAEVVAAADDFIASLGSKGPVVVAVRKTNCTWEEFLDAMEDSDRLEVSTHFDLAGQEP
jgi:hypothetical protein